MIKVALDATVACVARLVAFGAGLFLDRLEVAHEFQGIGLVAPVEFLVPVLGSGEGICVTGFFGNGLVATAAIREQKVRRVVITSESVTCGIFPDTLPIDACTGEIAGFVTDFINHVAFQAAA